MAGVLRIAAGRLRATTIRPSLWVTTLRRPTLFVTGPRSSAVPRFVHTEITREEISELVKQGVEKGMIGPKGDCFERYQRVSLQILTLNEQAVARHQECMTGMLKAEQRVATIAYRVGLAMAGLAAASMYREEIGKIITNIFGVPPPPPTKEEISAAIKEGMKEAKDNIHDDIKDAVKVAVAEHFLEEEKKKELRSKG